MTGGWLDIITEVSKKKADQPRRNGYFDAIKKYVHSLQLDNRHIFQTISTKELKPANAL